MKYTQDWFTPNIPNFERVRELIGRPDRILEVGSFEGRSTCWMLEFMLQPSGTMVCVDTFKGGVEHDNLDLSDLYYRFKHNTDIAKLPGQDIRVFQMSSYKAMSEMVNWRTKPFDFIYLDGSHEAPDVLMDAMLAWRLLREDGVMLFDDVGGGAGVGLAVASFVNVYKPQLDVVINNYQLGIRKRPSASQSVQTSETLQQSDTPSAQAA